MRRPYYGPRAACWEVFLDGRHVVITGDREAAMRQASKARGAGRAARVVREECCPHPDCRAGRCERPRRPGGYPRDCGPCSQCDGYYLSSFVELEGEESALISEPYR